MVLDVRMKLIIVIMAMILILGILVGGEAFGEDTHYFCDICNKDMSYEKNGKTCSVIGVEVTLATDRNDKEWNQFAKKQVGVYELNRNYRACWECVLRILGVKEVVTADENRPKLSGND